MLRSFRVTNHRSIRDEQELLLMPGYEHRLSVLPVTAIFGANASGKSNLLDALRWFQSAVRGSYRSWEADGGIPRRPFRLDALSGIQPSVFVVDLLIDGVQYVYGVELDGTAVLEEWLHSYPHQRKRVIFERHGQTVELGSTVPEGRGRADLLGSLLRENALLLSTAVQAKQDEVMPVYRWFANSLRFVGTGVIPRLKAEWAERVITAVDRHPAFTELLKAADLDITDLRVIETSETPSALTLAQADRLAAELEAREQAAPMEQASPELMRLRQELWLLRRPRTRKEILFLHGPEGIPLAVEDQSAGTRAWVDLLVTTMDALESGATLVTDEIDASLHPRLTARLIELFRSEATNPRGAQLIFTTHDATLLGTTLGEDLLRRDEVWFIEKKGSASSLYPLSDFHPRKGENRERRYLSGSYGAVPVVFPDSLVDRLVGLQTEESGGSDVASA
ncbi:ATP-binding protein [Actinoplanes sp. NPDC051851]|uniref:AAA family ATPase n=1 Tax=Actinoplanes sp. NPDC051851 TaxID=3154753 RepID=UPI0034183A99